MFHLEHVPLVSICYIFSKNTYPLRTTYILLFLFDRLAQRIVQGDVPQALMNRRVSDEGNFCCIHLTYERKYFIN